MNSHSILEKDVSLPRVMVWATISFMGPIFFDGTVNQDNYLYMLQTKFWPRVRNQNDIYFQQHGMAHVTTPLWPTCSGIVKS